MPNLVIPAVLAGVNIKQVLVQFATNQAGGYVVRKGINVFGKWLDRKRLYEDAARFPGPACAKCFALAPLDNDVAAVMPTENGRYDIHFTLRIVVVSPAPISFIGAYIAYAVQRPRGTAPFKSAATVSETPPLTALRGGSLRDVPITIAGVDLQLPDRAPDPAYPTIGVRLDVCDGSYVAVGGIWDNPIDKCPVTPMSIWLPVRK